MIGDEVEGSRVVARRSVAYEGADHATGARREPVRRTPLRVLHVEDSEDDSELVMRQLRLGGFEPRVERVDTEGAFRAALRAKDWDVIVSDYALPHYSGLDALADARREAGDIPFILVSGTISEDVAVSAMRAGAQDYVLKGALGRLPLAIEREVREATGRALQRRMAERLAISERMASAGLLAAGVAHEINNPLAVIMANLDFVTGLLGQLAPDVRAPQGQRADLGERIERLSAGLLEEADAPLRDAREAAERIRGIVRDVKLFSRPHDEERGPVDVRVVVESASRMAWNEIRHRAQLVTQFGDGFLVDSNEARLGQVLLNLLVNAAQSMPEGRASQNKIHVVTRAAGSGRVAIEVRDTGTGIPAEISPRIFDPFFTTKPAGVGLGLGLARCYRMVTDPGGDITAESEVGKGSLFRVTLPIAKSERRATVPPSAVQRPARRARVLVVGDEIAVGRALQRGLGRYHDVVVLASGREAVSRIAAGERFDAILSDLMMPEVSGVEVHEELSRIALDQAKRMIFFSGGAFTDRARAFLDKVPNPCIEKPFELANILMIITGVLRRWDSDAPSG